MEFKYDEFKWFNHAVGKEVNEFFCSLTEEQRAMLTTESIRHVKSDRLKRVKWKEALELLCKMNVADVEKNKVKELDETHDIISKEYHKKLKSLIETNRAEYRRAFQNFNDMSLICNDTFNKLKYVEDQNNKLKEELDVYRSKELDEYEECLEE